MTVGGGVEGNAGVLRPNWVDPGADDGLNTGGTESPPTWDTAPSSGCDVELAGDDGDCELADSELDACDGDGSCGPWLGPHPAHSPAISAAVTPASRPDTQHRGDINFAWPALHTHWIIRPPPS